MTHDVIVIGGSYAGMAAALQLLRARRDVLVIDAGLRRNRFASHAHGFLGQDGTPPDQIAARARAQLEAYPTLRWHQGRAVTAGGQIDGFAVTTDDGQVHAGRRILLATGVRDILPAIPGLAERWGQSVFHCPYCHGYELDRGAIGVIGTGPMSVHQAEMVGEWGPVTFLPNGTQGDAALPGRGIVTEPGMIAGIDGHADVRLTDGRVLSFAGLFTAPQAVPSTDLWQTLGCATDTTQMGTMIRTDAMKQTTVPGVFAAGDVAKQPHSLSLAIGDGAWAGATLHRSLIFGL